MLSACRRPRRALGTVFYTPSTRPGRTSGYPEARGQSMILFSGYSTMPRRAGLLQLRNDVPHRVLVDDRVERHPVAVGQRRHRRVLQARAGSSAPLGRSAFRTFIIRPTLPSAAIAPLQHQDHVVHLLLASTGRRRASVGDEARRALQQTRRRCAGCSPCSELPVSVTSTMASASCGGLTSVAPQLNSTWAVDAVLGQPARRQADDLGGDALALQVLDRLNRRIVGHRQHPAHRPAAHLAEDQLGQLDDLGVVLQDPVVAGQAAVERAVLRRSAASPGRGSACSGSPDRRWPDSSCGWRR